MVIDGITYITVKEASAIIGVSESRVRQFIMKGRLPVRKIGVRLNVLPLVEVQLFARQDRPSHLHVNNDQEYE